MGRNCDCQKFRDLHQSRAIARAAVGCGLILRHAQEVGGQICWKNRQGKREFYVILTHYFNKVTLKICYFNMLL
jgi:hypothetical protein